MNKISLIIAFIFLFNPAINVVDVLPDFVAWLLILNSVSRLRYLSGKLDFAKSYIDKMVWLTLVKLIMITALPYIDGTMTLTVTFVFATLELVWGIPAFKNVYDGYVELSELYGGSGVYKPVVRRIEKVKTSDGMKVTVKHTGEGIQTVLKLTPVFWIIKNVLNVIPEFIELSGQSSFIAPTDFRSLLTYKPLFYVVCLSVTLMIGIIWLTAVIPFIKNIFNEKFFIEDLKQSYKEKIIDTGIHRANLILDAISIVEIAGIFMLGVIFDGMNIAPRFIFPLLMLIGITILSENGFKNKALIAFASASTLISLASYTVQWYFTIRYGYYYVTRSFEAYDFYVATTELISLEMILLFVTVIMLSSLLFKTLRQEGFKKGISGEYESKLLKGCRLRFVFNVILFVLAGVSTIVAFGIYHIFPEIWMILLALDVIWLVYSFALYSSIKESIQNRYMI